MSANIRVDSGISAGTRYWIDRPVLRVGSDPQCDISLPSAELAPHALTLEFRDGNYRVYNRSASPVYVGAAMVESGTAAVWRDGETIQLPGDLRVALEIDGDPRPAPRPDALPDDGIVEESFPVGEDGDVAGVAGEAPKKKSSSSSLVQLAVIGVCVLALVGLLTMKNGGGEKAAAADRPTFNQLVEESLQKDEAHQDIIRRLQYAQAAIVRYGYDNTKLARERFSKLRDQLVSHVDAVEGDQKADVERVLAYVEYQLGRL